MSGDKSKQPRVYYFSKQGIEYYADKTEPTLYPHLYEPMVKLEVYEQLLSRIEKLRAALQFYSDPYTWKYDTSDKPIHNRLTPIDMDCSWIDVGEGKSNLYCAGNKAREVLEADKLAAANEGVKE